MKDAPATPARTPTVFVLNGVIGVGKTSLGRAAATQLGAAFLDADDFRNHEFHWAKDALNVHSGLMDALQDSFRTTPRAIIARPLRKWDWVLMQQDIGAMGARSYCITLRANPGKILMRDRQLTTAEKDRMEEMIALGYDARDFSDAFLDTGSLDLDAAAAALTALCRKLTATPAASR